MNACISIKILNANSFNSLIKDIDYWIKYQRIKKKNKNSTHLCVVYKKDSFCLKDNKRYSKLMESMQVLQF